MSVERIGEKFTQMMREVYWVNKKTRHDVIVQFMGHINTVNVSLYEGGYDPMQKAVHIGMVDFGERGAMGKLNEMKHKLKEFRKK